MLITLLFALFLQPVQAQNRLSVESVGSLNCYKKLIDNIDLQRPNNAYLENEYEFLLGKLNKWLVELDIAADPIVRNSDAPLCFGYYQEPHGPNAIAVGNIGILFGLNLMSEIHQMAGAKYRDSLVFVLAHEFAHYVQNRHRLRFNYKLPMYATKQKELHADCMAGYLVRAHQEVLFHSQDDLKKFVASLGDAHAVGDHGLAEERVQALKLGISSASKDILSGKKVFQVRTADIIQHCSRQYIPVD